MKSLVQFHFGAKVPQDGIPISHILTDPITAKTSIILVDTSDIIPQNSFFEKDIEIELSDDHLTYFLDKNGFRITDQVNSKNKPLYYKHTLNHNIFTNLNGGSDVLVIDDEGNAISNDYWIYDPGIKTIYHSLSPEILGDAIFYVKYSRADSNNLLIDREHRELLNGGPAFHGALPTDVLPDGVLNPDADAYLIEERDGQPHYWRLTLPRSGKYFLKYSDEGLLKLRVPSTEQNEPWYIDIQSATVLTKELTSDQLLRYSISEFDLQNFYPFPPIRLITEKESRKISDNVIATDYKNLVISNKTPIDVLVYGIDGRLIHAMTTDRNKIGKTIRDIFWEVDVIESIDTATGRISLRNSLKPGETPFVSFYFKDNVYKYNKINFNPLYNRDILNQKIVILCKPNVVPIDESLYHVVLGEENSIISSSSSEITEWIGTGKTFEDLKHDWIFLPADGFVNTNNYALLGIATVTLPISPDDVSITDVRRSPGIPDNHVKDAIRDIPGVSQFWDIMSWDGPPIPINGAILVYLPAWIKNIYTEEEIRARASKFIPAGSVLMIRYY